MPPVHNEGPGALAVEASVVPFFDYKCDTCGLVLKNELVKHYDDVVVCECGDDMLRQVCAPPRHLDHTVDDGYGTKGVLPDSFRPTQVGYGGKPKASWRNKKDG